jgi:hypothetical protein
MHCGILPFGPLAKKKKKKKKSLFVTKREVRYKENPNE